MELEFKAFQNQVPGAKHAGGRYLGPQYPGTGHSVLAHRRVGTSTQA